LTVSRRILIHVALGVFFVGALKIGVVKYALKKGVAKDALALGSTPDFKLLEI
jgi:hypothetical protein